MDKRFLDIDLKPWNFAKKLLINSSINSFSEDTTGFST